uniref:RING-type E3 ubiquitin transferase n=1 Tax=Petromyzon marinus TaxID=7757 RepID=A0AAJ7XC83_PETMA|nr:LOW QUALITY PROTEIN: roquin-1-like [Petromyzon marinus]
MPVQAPQWTEFLSCPICCHEFDETLRRPVSLGCGHTACKTCLNKLHRKACPFDQTAIHTDIEALPVNFALLQLLGAQVPDSQAPGVAVLSVAENGAHYDASKKCVEELALLLKPLSGAKGVVAASQSQLSRPMQRKLVTLVNCQLVEEEGRLRAMRAARSLGERTVTELILQHQNPQQLSSNLWAAVRARGCQFLGPAMQEEALKLVLLALEDGSALSRKVLVLFVVQRLETRFPQASKTSIGHVVQLLYRASCFKVTKRDEDSSLMQLKEEFRTYEALRREHDSQIVQIAMEAGLRIAPDQWSSLLYGDLAHKSHMQSIIDKLQTPASFAQSVQELTIALQRTGDPANLNQLRPHLELLANIDPSPDAAAPTWEQLAAAMVAVKTVVQGLVDFIQNYSKKGFEQTQPLQNSKYKTSMCRDLTQQGGCPRGASCTFAHSQDELERYRLKNKKLAGGRGTSQSLTQLNKVGMGSSGLEPLASKLLPAQNGLMSGGGSSPQLLARGTDPGGFGAEVSGGLGLPAGLGIGHAAGLGVRIALGGGKVGEASASAPGSLSGSPPDNKIGSPPKSHLGPYAALGGHLQPGGLGAPDLTGKGVPVPHGHHHHHHHPHAHGHPHAHPMSRVLYPPPPPQQQQQQQPPPPQQPQPPPHHAPPVDVYFQDPRGGQQQQQQQPPPPPPPALAYDHQHYRAPYCQTQHPSSPYAPRYVHRQGAPPDASLGGPAVPHAYPPPSTADPYGPYPPPPPPPTHHAYASPPPPPLPGGYHMGHHGAPPPPPPHHHHHHHHHAAAAAAAYDSRRACVRRRPPHAPSPYPPGQRDGSIGPAHETGYAVRGGPLPPAHGHPEAGYYQPPQGGHMPAAPHGPPQMQQQQQQHRPASVPRDPYTQPPPSLEELHRRRAELLAQLKVARPGAPPVSPPPFAHSPTPPPLAMAPYGGEEYAPMYSEEEEDGGGEACGRAPPLAYAESEFPSQYSPWSCEAISSYIAGKEAKPRDVMATSGSDMTVKLSRSDTPSSQTECVRWGEAYHRSTDEMWLDQRRPKDEDPIIPFGESPTVSKWGAISRSARTSFRNTGPVQATASQGSATRPVNVTDAPILTPCFADYFVNYSSSCGWNSPTNVYPSQPSPTPQYTDRERAMAPCSERDHMRLEMELQAVNHQISQQSQIHGMQAASNTALLQREAQALALQPLAGPRRSPEEAGSGGGRVGARATTDPLQADGGVTVSAPATDGGAGADEQVADGEGPDDLDFEHCLGLELTQDELDCPGDAGQASCQASPGPSSDESRSAPQIYTACDVMAGVAGSPPSVCVVSAAAMAAAAASASTGSAGASPPVAACHGGRDDAAASALATKTAVLAISSSSSSSAQPQPQLNGVADAGSLASV